MSTVFVIQNASGHYYSKQGEWLSGKNAAAIYFGKFKDEALNQLIDITIKDVEVRAKVIDVVLNQRRQPVLDIQVQDDLTDPDKLLELEQSADKNEIGITSKSHAAM